MRRCLRPLALALAVLLPASALNAGQDGIRHRIDMTVEVLSGSPLVNQVHSAKGTLSVATRLSANSREARFFGLVSPVFSDIVISPKGGMIVPQTKIWEEDQCHQRRGLPKVTVISVHGNLRRGQDQLDVQALMRHIGLRVPADELTPGIKLPVGFDDIGPYYAVRAQTKNSRLNVDLKIYAFECRL